MREGIFGRRVFIREQAFRSIPKDRWNALGVEAYPPLRHEFLVALEEGGCLGREVGWHPRPLLLEAEDGQLLAAVPAYLKENSFGEFSYDWHWAAAHQQSRINYYPKLVVASPFTPASGPRILKNEASRIQGVEGELVSRVIEYAEEETLSSVHFLFANEAGLESLGLIERHGCQFHWFNPGYKDFEDFLTQLTSKRRKEILRERRQVREAGVEMRIRLGSEIEKPEWHEFHELYRGTFQKYGNHAALSEEFFVQVAASMGDRILLVTAHRNSEWIAAAWFLVGDRTLYGRYWGAKEEVASLHFEACYYQGIEFAISQGLSSFEPGAQGEHKIPRGFLPTRTRSYHWIRHPGFREGIRRHVQAENLQIQAYIEMCRSKSPYRHADTAGTFS